MTAPATKPHLIVVGGTWEHDKFGLLSDTVNRTQDTWQPHWIDYPASYGTPESYEVSKAAGKKALANQLARLPHTDEYAIIAYSQGCAIVEEYLREAARRPGLIDGQVLKKLVYVGLVASPYRPHGIQIGSDVGGFGISGALPVFRSPFPNPIWQQFALAGDLICACPPDSLIRVIEQLTPAMSARDPLAWGRDLRSKVTLSYVWKTFPELRTIRHFPRLLDRISDAVIAATVYQNSGIHTKYPTTPIAGKGIPATQWIANELKEIAWQKR